MCNNILSVSMNNDVKWACTACAWSLAGAVTDWA